ncbi:MAG: hypothetical protein QOG94_2665, partial [Solirubrobacteraceae bacterium]|nr:hypothetical protein [Solirubrobacteraceae bacterium]
IRRGLLPRLGAWNATTAGAAAFVALIAAAELVLPAVHETPPAFPADVLWHFRLASLAIGATLWAVLGLGFGVAAERLLATSTPRGSVTRVAA